MWTPPLQYFVDKMLLASKQKIHIRSNGRLDGFFFKKDPIFFGA
jgi:hypothetical protein